MASMKQLKRAVKAVIVRDNFRSISFAGKARPAIVGYFGEILALKHFQHIGMIAEYKGDCGIGYDLLINGSLKVEVKTATKGKDGRYNFALSKSAGDVKRFQDITKSDLVLLQCVVECGEIITFAVPTIVLQNNKYAKIGGNPRTYAGTLAQYRL